MSERDDPLQITREHTADLLQSVYLEDAEGVLVELRGCSVQDAFQSSLDNCTGS